MIKNKLINEFNNLNLNYNYQAVVSVSGGVDSFVLLDIITHLFKNIIVVFFDHQTRDEIADEKKIVKNYCKDKNILFISIVLHISKDKNFQSEARIQRYNYLNNIANKFKDSYIFTGHHLDDLAESYLMRKKENSLRHQMNFINTSNNITYVKPFLYVNKNNLYLYAQTYNINYLEDSSNKENKYFRNKVRNELNKKLIEDTNFYDLVISDHKEMIKKDMKINLLYEQTSTNNIINIKQLLLLNNDLIFLIINKQLLLSNITPKTKYIKQIIKILKDDKPNLEVTLENNYNYIKAYNKAFIKLNSNLKLKNLTLKLGNNVLQNNTIFTFFPHIDKSNNHYQKLCYNKLVFPLISRTRKSGDILEFSFGRKKLKDFFIDKKVPKNKRDEILLITDSNDQILIIPNLYVNKCLGDENIIYYQFQGDNNE